MDQDTMTTEPMATDLAGPPAPDPRGSRHRTRRIAVAMAGVAIVVLGVGASATLASSPAPAPSGGGTPATAPAPVFVTNVDSAEADAAFKDFAACMRDHGVDMPDPVRIDASSVIDGSGAAGLPTIEGGGAPGVTSASGLIVVGTGGPASTTDGTPGAITTAPAPDPAFEAANTACAPILEKAGIAGAKSVTTSGLSGSATLSGSADISGSGPTGGAIAAIGVAGGDVTKAAESMKTYAACMRSHGVDVPDPVVDTNAGTVQLSLAADPTSAAFRAADSACATDGFGFPAPTAP